MCSRACLIILYRASLLDWFSFVASHGNAFLTRCWVWHRTKSEGLPSPPPSHRHYKGFSRPDSAQSHITHNHTQWFPCSPGTHSLNVSSPLVHSVSLDNKTLERISVPTLPTVLEKHSHSHKKSNNCSPRKLLTLPNSKLWLLGTLYLCLPDATQFLPARWFDPGFYRSWPSWDRSEASLCGLR